MFFILSDLDSGTQVLQLVQVFSIVTDTVLKKIAMIQKFLFFTQPLFFSAVSWVGYTFYANFLWLCNKI